MKRVTGVSDFQSKTSPRKKQVSVKTGGNTGG